MKWPLLDELRTMPLFEGRHDLLVRRLGLLALLGLRYRPVAARPAVRRAVEGDLPSAGRCAESLAGALSEDMQEVVANCSVVILVLLVIPWSHARQRLVTGPADPWR